MPLNPRIRDNNVFGTVEDDPLVAGAVALNSAGLSTLSTIATGHATLTLDPLHQFGNPEIVIVTVHTAAGSIATITRGAYGTTARSHPRGTLWVHAAINDDFIQIASSIARPSNPYEGQFIFEVDSNRLVGYGGVDWAPRDAGGQIGFVENRSTADQIITGGALLTGLSSTVTVGTGRRIRATCKTNVFSDIIETSVYYEIRFDGVGLDKYFQNRLSGQSEQGVYWASVHSPAAGSHTYTVWGSRNGGTGVVTNRTQPAQTTFLLIEDIGAA